MSRGTAARRPEDPAPAPAPRSYDRCAVWAPAASAVDVRLDGQVHALEPGDDGWWALPGIALRPGSRYSFRLHGTAEDDSAEATWLPDPRSLLQERGVHEESTAVDPALLEREEGWGGVELRGAVIYEMHIGTFTAGPEGRGGTFDSAIERLDELVDLGVQALEIMPVASFPGSRGWGYDGVGLYAVHEAYGGPAAMARFVAAAHRRGLGVILDVVHNHLGPAGNYLSRFGPYFTDAHHTPWGWAVNLDGPDSDQVRAFLLGSVRQWLVDMQLDGLRLDAVHELHDDSPRHLLAELSEAVAALSAETGRPLALIAESDRNDPRTVTPAAAGGLGMDMQWADDVHHGVHAWATGERQGYYADFGSSEVLRRVLTRAFEHAGTYSSFREQVWGAPVDPASPHYDAHSFVAFLQDHDQVGNRAAGDRIHASLSPAEHAAAIAPILLGPFTPMLFQGEEWAASTPFAYFTDHEPELGRLVTQGRTEEFGRMGWAEDVPDPQALTTFTGSILHWDEAGTGAHARIRDWYRTLIALRRSEPALQVADLRRTRCEVLGEDTVLLRRGTGRRPGSGAGTRDGARAGAEAEMIEVLVHRGAERAELPASSAARAHLLASSAAVLSGRAADDAPLHLEGPGALVVRLTPPARG